MNFKQHDDGSCDIEFSKEEIEIINKKQKLHMPAETLKHFGNTLVAIVSFWNDQFNDEIKNKQTFINTEIKGK